MFAMKDGIRVPSVQEIGPPSWHLGGPSEHGGKDPGFGSDPSLHLGETPPAQTGLLPSAQGDFLVGEEPSAHTQVGFVPSPHGLRFGLVITVPSAHVQVGLDSSGHLGATLLRNPTKWNKANDEYSRILLLS